MQENLTVLTATNRKELFKAESNVQLSNIFAQYLLGTVIAKQVIKHRYRFVICGDKKANALLAIQTFYDENI